MQAGAVGCDCRPNGTGPTQFCNGDANLDGVVDAGDLDVMALNWGSMAVHPGADLPKPGSLLFLLAGAGLLRGIRRPPKAGGDEAPR